MLADRSGARPLSSFAVSEIISEFEMFEIRSSALRSCEGCTGHSHQVQSRVDPRRYNFYNIPPIICVSYLGGRSPCACLLRVPQGASVAGGHETVRSARGVLQEARLREGELGAKRDSCMRDSCHHVTCDCRTCQRDRRHLCDVPDRAGGAGCGRGCVWRIDKA